jgi:glycosyltransferase involved in cell wall biosynthesis
MPKWKVLQLSTYPISPRIHGGQRRCGAINDAFQRNGVDVLYVSVGRPIKNELPPGQVHIAVTKELADSLEVNHLLEDILLGQHIFRDSTTRDPFLQHVKRFRPNVVVVEQPYVWPGLKELFAEGRMAELPVVFSSHNIEYAMKEELHTRSLPPSERGPAVDMVRHWEEELCEHSELVVSVSEADAEVLRGMGAANCAVVRNGNDRKRATPEKVHEWTERLLDKSFKRFALFVSSGHLPNCLDFEQMVGRFLGYLPPETGIVVAGSAAYLIDRNNLCNSRDNLSRSRLSLHEHIGDDDLAALLQLTSAILLPVRRGGGSNIKTVEALFSGRPVIGTTYAFRSFEEFAGLDRVRICDEPGDFRATMQQTLLDPKAIPTRADYWSEQLNSITWDNLGNEFVDLMATADWQRPHRLKPATC